MLGIVAFILGEQFIQVQLIESQVDRNVIRRAAVSLQDRKLAFEAARRDAALAIHQVPKVALSRQIRRERGRRVGRQFHVEDAEYIAQLVGRNSDWSLNPFEVEWFSHCAGEIQLRGMAPKRKSCAERNGRIAHRGEGLGLSFQPDVRIVIGTVSLDFHQSIITSRSNGDIIQSDLQNMVAICLVGDETIPQDKIQQGRKLPPIFRYDRQAAFLIRLRTSRSRFEAPVSDTLGVPLKDQRGFRDRKMLIAQNAGQKRFSIDFCAHVLDTKHVGRTAPLRIGKT
ncbi:hypothetical protein SMD27_06810 [Dongia soli]|uniref:Uncharacterized protein n=1 Tax=Dongia soli TaxID=600628 RepID=A0ABU5E9F4_9PROT|nr:hypothetical protein [Dongia soli]MDY0882547.1 hypothetical protein [Dongia soli]